MLGSYHVRVSGRLLQSKVFPYEKVTSFGPSCKEQARTLIDSKGRLAGALL